MWNLKKDAKESDQLLCVFQARKATQVVHTKMKQRDFRLIQTLVVILVAYLVTFVPCTVVMIVVSNLIFSLAYKSILYNLSKLIF